MVHSVFLLLVTFPVVCVSFIRGAFWPIFAQKHISPARQGSVAVERVVRSNFHQNAFLFNKEATKVLIPKAKSPDNSIKRLSFADGSEYLGEVVDGQKHGKGRWINQHGHIYEGEFRDNKLFEGNKTVNTPHGAIVTYFYTGGVRGIVVRKVHQDGFIYEGEYRHDREYGLGTLTYPNNRTYMGHFKSGKKHGPGKETFQGYVLEGWFEGGRIMNGNGTLVMSDGNMREGTWVNGFIEGPGKMTSRDNKVVQGEFRHGKLFNGSGVKVVNDGNLTYEGTWVKGLMTGPGKKISADNFNYVGNFSNSKENGNGVLIYPDGSKYEGEWFNGMKHGQAIKTSAQGDVCKGEYRNNHIYNAKGVLVKRSGEKFVGEWVNGEFKPDNNLRV